MICRRALGRRFSGREAASLGLNPKIAYRICLRVLGMGTSNAPDIAQAARETLVGRFGCLRPGTVLRYRDSIPDSSLLEGICLDDHVVLGIVKKSEVRGSSGPDRDAVDQSHRAYNSVNLKRSESKAFGLSDTGRAPRQAAVNFTAWGTEVRGEQGLVRAPARKCVELAMLVFIALARPTTCRFVLERILGLLVHPLVHLRCLTSSLGSSYLFVASLPPRGLVRWPPRVREELWGAALCLLVAEVDIRDMSSLLVSATDATPTRGGAVRALAHPALARVLYDFAEHRGEHVRLDASPAALALRPTHMMQPTTFSQEVVRDLVWEVTRSSDFPEAGHINIQEAKEVLRELRSRCNASLVPQRVANFVDSRVVLGGGQRGVPAVST